MTNSKEKRIKQELLRELQEEGEIDIFKVNLPELASMVNLKEIQMYDQSEYSIEDVINIIIEQNSSLNSFLIFDMGAVFRRFRIWKRFLPKVESFYAVKSNPDPMLLKTLAGLGLGFDVASKSEIKMVSELLSIEDRAEQVIYANPVRGINHITYAKSQGVDLLTLDSLDELKKLSVYHPQAKLVLRILVDDSKSKMPLGSKFGCPPENVPAILELARNMNLNVVGVSFHVGSGCSDPQAYQDAISRARDVFRQAETFGFKLSILDIGGGFPGDEASMPIFQTIAKGIDESLTTHFSDVDGLRIISELGRFISCQCGIIVVYVIGKKIVNPGIYHYTVNSSIYSVFNNKIFDHGNPEFKVLNNNTNKRYPSIIFGQTCDSADKLCDEIQLPELSVGDCLYVCEAGAYTLASASTFNGFELPGVNYIFTF